MLKALANVFLIPELRNRVLFTLGMIAIYRIGFWIPLVGVDQQALKDAASKASEGGSGWGQLLDYVSIFSGGSLQQSTIFGLGIMPYITASIIFQLLQSAVPRLQELKKEGASGQQKITEWTRYATVAMCLIQGFMWLKFLIAQGLVRPEFLTASTTLAFYLSGVAALTAGSIFLMWLGEQIDKYGIGNGVSLILTAGIISQMPNAVGYLVAETDLSRPGDRRQHRHRRNPVPGRGLHHRRRRFDPDHRRPAAYSDPAGATRVVARPTAASGTICRFA